MRKNEGLGSRLERFFQSNPGHDLTYDQICDKFFVSKQWARTLVGQMVAEGKVESVHIIRLKEKT